MGYNKEIYNSALDIINNRKNDDINSLQKRQAQLYINSPRAKEIEIELSKTGVAIAKTVLSGSNVKNRLEELKSSNLSLQNELKQILKDLSLPPNYLELNYTCNKCRDSGFIDGKMCKCLIDIMKNLAYDELNKLSPLSISTFESFNLAYYSKEKLNGNMSAYDKMSKIFNYCKEYANNFTTKSKNIFMQGKTGLGKTHLSLAISGNVIDKGYGCVYASAPDLLNQIEKEHFHYNNNSKNTLENIIDCDLLILDDLGTEFQTSFTSATIYNALNSRILREKPFILNTNLSMQELQKAYSERFVSRIIGYADRLDFIGSDIRQKIK